MLRKAHPFGDTGLLPHKPVKLSVEGAALGDILVAGHLLGHVPLDHAPPAGFWEAPVAGVRRPTADGCASLTQGQKLATLVSGFEASSSVAVSTIWCRRLPAVKGIRIKG
jgi:hypothetical protein